MQVIASYPYHTRILPGPPTHLLLIPWPLTLLSQAPFSPLSTVASKPFSSVNMFIPFFGVLTLALPISLRMHLSLISLTPDVLEKTPSSHKLQPFRGPWSQTRLGFLLPTRTHTHYKWGFLIHSNKAFGLGICNKIGAEWKQWGEISLQIDQNSLL